MASQVLQVSAVNSNVPFRQYSSRVAAGMLARFTVELQTRRGLLSFSLGERGEPRLRGRAGTAG
jgi:hypothetical protein